MTKQNILSHLFMIAGLLMAICSLWFISRFLIASFWSPNDLPVMILIMEVGLPLLASLMIFGIGKMIQRNMLHHQNIANKKLDTETASIKVRTKNKDATFNDKGILIVNPNDK